MSQLLESASVFQELKREKKVPIGSQIVLTGLLKETNYHKSPAILYPLVFPVIFSELLTDYPAQKPE